MHPLEEKDSSPLEDAEITRLINVSKELGYKKQDKIPERNLVDFKPTSIMQIARSSNQKDQTKYTPEAYQSPEMKQTDSEVEIKDRLYSIRKMNRELAKMGNHVKGCVALAKEHKMHSAYEIRRFLRHLMQIR